MVVVLTNSTRLCNIDADDSTTTGSVSAIMIGGGKEGVVGGGFTYG